MKLAELAFACYIYTYMSGYDSSYRRFVDAIGPELDLGQEQHRMALLKWLNDWGCRQFAKEYHALASAEIAVWYRGIASRLLPLGKSLLLLSAEDFRLVEQAYTGLVPRTASLRKLNTMNASQVQIGPTGAAKILFALRPDALIPWDDPMRVQFGYDGSASSYTHYLYRVKRHLEELGQACEDNGYKLEHLPQLLNKPFCSLTKLIDEYHWVTISRKCPVPASEEIAKWQTWQ
jgi:hypothetical protein